MESDWKCIENIFILEREMMQLSLLDFEQSVDLELSLTLTLTLNPTLNYTLLKLSTDVLSFFLDSLYDGLLFNLHKSDIVQFLKVFIVYLQQKHVLCNFVHICTKAKTVLFITETTRYWSLPNTYEEHMQSLECTIAFTAWWAFPGSVLCLSPAHTVYPQGLIPAKRRNYSSV